MVPRDAVNASSHGRTNAPKLSRTPWAQRIAKKQSARIVHA
jgi:hypothetical protein